MAKVHPAEAYRYCAMDSFGNAAYMLIRQFQFPDEFDVRDQLMHKDHDRLSHEHVRTCFAKHTGTGDFGFEQWARETEPKKVMAFLIDILEAKKSVRWTGFRILGTVNRRNGHPVWTLELFAKHPKSETPVFDTENAPNLIQGSRHTRH